MERVSRAWTQELDARELTAYISRQAKESGTSFEVARDRFLNLADNVVSKETAGLLRRALFEVHSVEFPVDQA